MLKYASPDLAELAHQFTLSPRRQRIAQLQGIDHLLGIVEPEKSYPYDLVCFHITGRRPLKQNQKPGIAGQDLIGDLSTMAEHITRRAQLRIDSLPGEYKTHDEVARDLGVSTKTIRRWRSRGLMGMRAFGDDGVSRLVFSTSAVERFKERNKRLVERGASFKLLTQAEKDGMVETARAILTERRRKLHVIARRIAQDTGRAVETVRYTLRQYDAANPESALFAGNGEPSVSQAHLAVHRCRERGETPEQIARAIGTTAKRVRALLAELDARRLKADPIEYVDNELFSSPSADEIILESPRPTPPEEGSKRIRTPSGLPAYLRSLYEVPLLTREQEADLFRRYNYLRYRAARAVEQLDVFSTTRAALDAINADLGRAELIKKEIVQANLRLVVSIAKRHVGWSGDLFEVISDGNLSLIRAVERFDYSLGNKFSTYGSWAIMKNFARSVPESRYHLRRFVTGQDEMLASQADEVEARMSASDIESVRGALGEGLKHLTERERTIVTHHFGLFSRRGTTSTLDELGRRFGITKERIRQIEKRAIAKLREVVSPTLLEAFAE